MSELEAVKWYSVLFARVAIELLVPGYESDTDIPTVLGAGPPNNGMPKANTSSWLAAGKNTTS